MSGRRILFQWAGFASAAARARAIPERSHVVQVSCAAVFPTKAAFLRATDSKPSRWPYVSVEVLEDDEVPANEGARIAAENPGVVYYEDKLSVHAPRDAEWRVHENPSRA